MPVIVNGSVHDLPDDPRVSLLDLLRERLGLPGTKKGCDQGACGACTVLADGERILSCLTLAVTADGKSITTIEGLGTPDDQHSLQSSSGGTTPRAPRGRGDEEARLSPLQRAFVDRDGFQCGYCTPGQICSAVGMAAEAKRGVPSHVTADLASENVALTRDEIRERMSGNLCRCGAHNGIIDAITQTYATDVNATDVYTTEAVQ